MISNIENLLEKLKLISGLIDIQKCKNYYCGQQRMKLTKKKLVQS